MFLPDLWIKMLKETPDEFWSMGHLCHSMTNRRWKEKCVGYAESHDQAIVGDKTIAQWLFDTEIYTGMSKKQSKSIRIDRGIALHKMIRLLTQSLGGQAYLNFMGNEFGHPEWIDFPREGNNYSYHYCRRQWNLVDDQSLLFDCLNEFDKVMNKWESIFNVMESEDLYITLKHEEDKVIIFEKANLLFAFNFHPSKSFENYRIGTQWNSDHIILFDTDSASLGGNGRLNAG
jgi:1,4-alpha-glucan branching enzyme